MATEPPTSIAWDHHVCQWNAPIPSDSKGERIRPEKLWTQSAASNTTTHLWTQAQPAAEQQEQQMRSGSTSSSSSKNFYSLFQRFQRGRSRIRDAELAKICPKPFRKTKPKKNPNAHKSHQIMSKCTSISDGTIYSQWWHNMHKPLVRA